VRIDGFDPAAQQSKVGPQALSGGSARDLFQRRSVFSSIPNRMVHHLCNSDD